MNGDVLRNKYINIKIYIHVSIALKYTHSHCSKRCTTFTCIVILSRRKYDVEKNAVYLAAKNNNVKKLSDLAVKVV